MPGAIQITAEWLGNSGWYVHVIGPRGARERRRDVMTVEQLFDVLREDIVQFGAAILPSPPVVPPAPLPQAEPRFVRHARKEDAPPPIPAAEPTAPPRVSVSKKQAARMRVAADEKALAEMSADTRDAVTTRKAQAGRRR